YWAVASVQQLVAAYTDATESYRMAIQYGRAADNAVAEMMAVSGLAQMALEQGHLQRSFEIATEAVQRIERAGVLPPISALAYGVLAQIYYEWQELEQARRYGRRALELSTLGGYNSGIAGCRAFLARLYQLEADLEMATGEIQKAVDLVQGEAPAYIRQEVVAQQVRVYLAQGRLAAAQIALQGEGFSFQDAFTFPELPDGARISHSSGLLYNSSLYLLLAEARAGGGAVNLAVGMPLADWIIVAAREGRYRLVELEALLLRAQMHAERGSAAASAADYTAALALAAPEGFTGIFLDQGPRLAEALAQLRKQNKLERAQAEHADGILDAFARLSLSGRPREPEPATGAPPAALVEPLSERELEVLNLMAVGLTYQEIAARLFISLNTVRFHVKAIYGKLNVHKRGQAVESARQLGIL
ncbi:MAG: LuxR C-terminal-related transcriptional regulator, partial [Anaerolineae bacterium]|nr:LuxR C-terminal-related transcriptional regulator [Anaerolineae bacterium]